MLRVNLVLFCVLCVSHVKDKNPLPWDNYYVSMIVFLFTTLEAGEKNKNMIVGMRR